MNAAKLQPSAIDRFDDCYRMPYRPVSAWNATFHKLYSLCGIHRRTKAEEVDWLVDRQLMREGFDPVAVTREALYGLPPGERSAPRMPRLDSVRLVQPDIGAFAGDVT